jgi:hypothetical protein
MTKSVGVTTAIISELCVQSLNILIAVIPHVIVRMPGTVLNTYHLLNIIVIRLTHNNPMRAMLFLPQLCDNQSKVTK